MKVDNMITSKVHGWVEDGIQIPVLFMYDPETPFTIAMGFKANLVWEISREALMECLQTGEGGFLNTVFMSDGESLYMNLSSEKNPEGFMVEFDHGELTSFIHMTYDAVPEGKETLDIDNLIADIIENTKLGD